MRGCKYERDALVLGETNTMQFQKLLFLAMLALGCNSKERMPRSHEAEEIRRISAARARAFNEGDAEGIARHFSNSCHLMAPGGKTKTGPTQVRAYYQSIFDRYDTELESGYEEVKIDGDLAYGRGFAKVRLKDKSTGEVTVSTAKYLNILERQSDGSWKTTHDIWNGNEQ